HRRHGDLRPGGARAAAAAADDRLRSPPARRRELLGARGPVVAQRPGAPDERMTDPFVEPVRFIDERTAAAPQMRKFMRYLFPDHWSFLLDEVGMSDAFKSVLDISLTYKGGLLIRQTHHWAADVFVAAILMHLMRVFFTGAFRKPRELTWIVGLILLFTALLEGYL